MKARMNRNSSTVKVLAALVFAFGGGGGTANATTRLVYALNCGAASMATNGFAPDDYLLEPHKIDPSLTSDRSLSSLTDPVSNSVLSSAVFHKTLTWTLPNLNAAKTYDLRLYFMETYYSSAGGRVMSVSVNGETKETGIDPYSIGGGTNIPVERVYAGVSPAADGKLTVSVTGTVDNAQVCALALVENDSDNLPLVPCVKGAFTQTGGTLVVIGSQTGDVSYDIRRKAVGGSEYETLATGAGNQWIDAGVTAGYVYSARAVDAGGAASEWSADTAATPGTARDYVALSVKGGQVGSRGTFEPYTAYTLGTAYYPVDITGAQYSHVREPAPSSVYDAVIFGRRGADVQLAVTNLYPGETYLCRVHIIDNSYSVRTNRLWYYTLNGQLVQPTFDTTAEVQQYNVLLKEDLVKADALGRVVFLGKRVKDNVQLSAFELVRQTPEADSGISALVRGSVNADGAQAESGASVSSEVRTDWSSGSKANSRNNQVTWQGILTAPADGLYTFRAQQSGYYDCWIDDASVINAHDSAASNTVASSSGSVFLTAGAHRFRARQVQGAAPFTGSLYWSAPFLSERLVAAPYLTTTSSTAASIGQGEWNLAGIGNRSLPGDFYRLETNVWRMTSSGTDIGGQIEKASFAYQKVNGEFTLIARVRAFARSTVSNAKLGLMLRTDLGECQGDYSYSVMLRRRLKDVTSCEWWYSVTGDSFRDGTTNIVESNQIAYLQLPRWLKAERFYDEKAGTYKAVFGYSDDGSNWLSLTTNTLSATKSVYVGLVVCGRDGALPVAEVDNLTLTKVPPRGTSYTLR